MWKDIALKLNKNAVLKTLVLYSCMYCLGVCTAWVKVFRVLSEIQDSV
jgi:hypothetical protein